MLLPTNLNLQATVLLQRKSHMALSQPPPSPCALQFAEHIRALIRPDAAIIHEPATMDDPKQRRPDITRAGALLRWAPRTPVSEGIARTILYFKHELGCATEADPAPPTVWMPPIADVLPADYLTARNAGRTAGGAAGAGAK